MEGGILQQYASVVRLFNMRESLAPSFVPDRIIHRDEQIRQLASILAIAVRGEKPSNILVFGKTGTGKTATVKHLGYEIRKTPGKADFVYLNCEFSDTPYGIVYSIGNIFVNDFEEKIPFTGLSMQKLYAMLKERLDSEERVVIIVLDEVDKLVKKSGDDILYHLCELNEQLAKARISIIGITNDVNFADYLDSRVRSRLGSEQIVFPPYNAEQLTEILHQRAESAFCPNALDENVVSLCAALAAQEHGDARRALDLLRVSGELAEREGAGMVTCDHIYRAKNKIELDCVVEAVRSLPTQSKLILYDIILNEEHGNGKLTSGEVFNTYVELCRKVGLSVLTQRRVTDLISELSLLGLIDAQVRSFGRGGRTKEIFLRVPLAETKRVLEGDDMLQNLKEFKTKFQTRLM